LYKKKKESVDFAGPYFINEGELAFGSPTKYLQLNPMLIDHDIMKEHSDSELPELWDTFINKAKATYEKKMVNYL
jgi:hypothetical protein